MQNLSDMFTAPTWSALFCTSWPDAWALLAQKHAQVDAEITRSKFSIADMKLEALRGTQTWCLGLQHACCAAPPACQLAEPPFGRP